VLLRFAALRVPLLLRAVLREDAPLRVDELLRAVPLRLDVLLRAVLLRLDALLRAVPLRLDVLFLAELRRAPLLLAALLLLRFAVPLFFAPPALLRPVVPLFLLLLLARAGKLLRLALAILCSSLSLMELAICREAPFRLDRERSPRFADRAAPAAFCCCLDLAGIVHHSL
jgi:hypothetical protein